MKHKILFVLLLAFSTLFFFSCEKEYSCEDCGGAFTGAAIFTFNGGCTGAIVSGNLIAGTAATSTNTVTLQVVVDSVGSYSVTTNNINGVSYSAAGFFTQKGAQTIIIRANGTPAAAGDFSYTVTGTSGCSFTVTAAPVIDTNFSYYYEATIDGTFYKEVVTTTNGYMANTSIVGTGDVIPGSNILPFAYPPMPTGKTGMAVGKGILYNYPTRNNTEFKTFFNLGSYGYTSNPTASNGVTITWYDTNGTEWKTNNTPADQSGSLIAIVLVEEVAVTPYYTVAITFSFNCKLYDANGNVKTLTGGKYKGVFSKL